MKILIILLLLGCTSLNTPYYSTTWNGTANNQGITFTALNDLYNSHTVGLYPFCDGGSIPSNSLRLVTKDAFNAQYCNNIGTIYIIPSKTGSQVLAKRDFGFYIFILRTTSQSDCSGFGAGQYIYMSADFTKAYTNAAQTTAFNGGGNAYISGSIYVSTQMAYLIIDASGNITTFTNTTC